MNKHYCFLLIVILCISCQRDSQKDRNGNKLNSVIKIKMYLDGFGVEGNNFPSSIDGEIDFQNKKSKFQKTYYDPSIKASTYSLNDKEIKTLFDLIQKTDLTILKKNIQLVKIDPTNQRQK